MTEGNKNDPGLPGLSRRSFLKMAGAIGASAFLLSHGAEVAKAIEASPTKLVWLRGAGCGGCTSSFLNGGNPEVMSALSRIKLDLSYHEGLMCQQGIYVDGAAANNEQSNSLVKLNKVLQGADYLLIVEGAILNGPGGSGKYHMNGGVPLKDMVEQASKGASQVLALGTCASYGGISRALEDEVRDARGLGYTGTSDSKGLLFGQGIHKKLINVPGCPAHPDWALLTIADLLAGIEVETDTYQRPRAFFGNQSVHESCSRRGYFDRAVRSKVFGEETCLFEMGCKGPQAYADCPVRRWNGGTSMCTQSGGPCIACVEPGFPEAFMPFFKKSESRDVFADLNVDTAARIVLGAAALGAGVHAVKRLAIGESDRDEYDIPDIDEKKRVL